MFVVLAIFVLVDVLEIDWRSLESVGRRNSDCQSNQSGDETTRRAIGRRGNWLGNICGFPVFNDGSSRGVVVVLDNDTDESGYWQLANASLKLGACEVRRDSPLLEEILKHVALQSIGGLEYGFHGRESALANVIS